MPVIGFLHTSPVHEPAFSALVALAAGDEEVDQHHLVDVSLLDDARSHGITEVLQDRIRGHLNRLAGAVQVDVIVCTCSTISAEADRIALAEGIVLVRVDRPMAELAVAAGRRIGVAAAVTSTIAPTRALLSEVATAGGFAVDLVDIDCTAAWASFERGDMSAYLSEVAGAIRASDVGPFDVVVLAQASMAGAAELLAGERYPVLSSPGPSVARALEVVRARR